MPLCPVAAPQKFERVHLNEMGWLSVLFAVAAGLISTRYLTGLPDVRWWQTVYVFFGASGVALSGHFVLQLLTVFPIGRVNQKAARWTAFCLTCALLVALVTDTFVYQQYRFHINWPMIDLALVGGRDVFSFSWGMIFNIALWVACRAVAAAVLVRGSVKVRSPVGWWCAPLLLGYVAVNFVNAYSVSQNVRAVTVLTERIPLYYPLRANRLLAKFGLVAVTEDHVKVDEVAGSFRYPLNSLTYGKGSGQNVLLLAIDSLRGDVTDAKTMPNLSRIKEKSIEFTQHYSGGNGTRAGIFSLFYGLPPSYWQSALATNIPSALVSGFRAADYEVTAFTTATLLRPEFYATVFSGVPNLRMGSTEGETVAERDIESVDDFKAWLAARDPNKKFMSFMFLDSAHAVDFPSDMEVPYKDYWETVDRLELSPDFDPKPFFNRYKNSVYWQDMLIGRVFEILEKTGRLDDTIVIVTADHGEEFNDGKLNYWGHNGNFSQAQIGIPLIVYWPGMQPQKITHRTTAYDVSATLMHRVLGVENPTEDYSVGTDLFDAKLRKVFYAGSYNEDAIVAGDEVLLIKTSGAMEGRHLQGWAEIESDALKKWVPDYLRMRGKYRQ